jgi:hypothetical protein
MQETVTTKIKTHVTNMINYIDNTKLVLNVEFIEKSLEREFEFLLKSYPTIFKLIIRVFLKDTGGSERSLFHVNLEQMLLHLESIEDGTLTKESASENIGKILAKQYIPMYKNDESYVPKGL